MAERMTREHVVFLSTKIVKEEIAKIPGGGVDYDARITKNTTDIAANAHNIATNTTAIAAIDITGIEHDIIALQHDVAKNTLDIAKNKTDITANTTAISGFTHDLTAVEHDVAKNVLDIAKNAADISTNTTNIALSSGDIHSNKLAIAKNEHDIAVNASAIATNKTNITSMMSVMVQHPGSVTGDHLAVWNGPTGRFLKNSAADIQDVLDNSAHRSGDGSDHANVATNTTNIATNTINIAANVSAIATNKSHIATNTTTIQQGLIATNALVAANTTSITANTAQLAGATADIESIKGSGTSDGFIVVGTLHPTLDYATYQNYKQVIFRRVPSQYQYPTLPDPDAGGWPEGARLFLYCRNEHGAGIASPHLGPVPMLDGEAVMLTVVNDNGTMIWNAVRIERASEPVKILGSTESYQVTLGLPLRTIYNGPQAAGEIAQVHLPGLLQAQAGRGMTIGHTGPTGEVHVYIPKRNRVTDAGGALLVSPIKLTGGQVLRVVGAEYEAGLCSWVGTLTPRTQQATITASNTTVDKHTYGPYKQLVYRPNSPAAQTATLPDPAPNGWNKGDEVTLIGINENGVEVINGTSRALLCINDSMRATVFNDGGVLKWNLVKTERAHNPTKMLTATDDYAVKRGYPHKLIFNEPQVSGNVARVRLPNVTAAHAGQTIKIGHIGVEGLILVYGAVVSTIVHPDGTLVPSSVHVTVGQMLTLTVIEYSTGVFRWVGYYPL